MAVRTEENALTRVAKDPVSRRKFLAVGGGLAPLRSSPPAAATATRRRPRSAAAGAATGDRGKVRQGRRRHPQLRADPRVPGDGFLRRRGQERALQGLRPGDDQEVRRRGGRTRRRAHRLRQEARRQARAEAEDRIPAEERQVGARTGRRRSRTSAPRPIWARRRTSRPRKCSRRRSRSTASRAATRRRSTPCWANRSRPTVPLRCLPARRRCSSPSNPSSSAERRAKRKENAMTDHELAQPELAGVQIDGGWRRPLPQRGDPQGGAGRGRRLRRDVGRPVRQPRAGDVRRRRRRHPQLRPHPRVPGVDLLQGSEDAGPRRAAN